MDPQEPTTLQDTNTNGVTVEPQAMPQVQEPALNVTSEAPAETELPEPVVAPDNTSADVGATAVEATTEGVAEQVTDPAGGEVPQTPEDPNQLPQV